MLHLPAAPNCCIHVHTCAAPSWHTLMLDPSAAPSCWTLLPHALAGPLCRTLLLDPFAAPSCCYLVPRAPSRWTPPSAPSCWSLHPPSRFTPVLHLVMRPPATPKMTTGAVVALTLCPTYLLCSTRSHAPSATSPTMLWRVETKTSLSAQCVAYKRAPRSSPTHRCACCLPASLAAGSLTHTFPQLAVAGHKPTPPALNLGPGLPSAHVRTPAIPS